MLLLSLDFGLGLWSLTSYARPRRGLQFLYFVGYFLTHFYGLSAKFGHSGGVGVVLGLVGRGGCP
jgi:hypothetical protein